MVIDALRWDFVTGPIGKAAMPVTNGLLSNFSACLLKTKLQSPTVTMPRIKAMMTGTVPNFVDIVLNFGSKPLNSDSLLLQAKKTGHTLVFYGDDTWLSLFPYTFERYDGTTSFFVTDFTEVDNNVTRHVSEELDYDDWTVMILHYLGLDHIGHVEGPFSALIKPKLQEMDEIIAQISRRVHQWNNEGTPVLFVVCGDHGMKDSGGHGGSTPQETTVPFIAIGDTHCARQKSGDPIEIEQIDIASTLSAALGLPIPATNIGSMFLDSIYRLDDEKRLFLLYYNTRQVLEHYQKLAHCESQIENVRRKYTDTVYHHVTWLNASEKSSEAVENIVSSYNAILKEMKEALITSVVEYDFRPMIVAVIFLCQLIVNLFFVKKFAWSTCRKTASHFLTRFFLLGTVLSVGICYLYGSSSASSFRSISTYEMVLLFLVIGVFYTNCNLCASSDLSLTEFTKGSRIRGTFQIGALLHTASLASSSFIEEEHQTWYFLYASTVAFLLYHCFRKQFAFNRYDLTSVKKTGSKMNLICGNSGHVKLSLKLLLLLIGHRVLRGLNSTGDKWAHLPDTADWLKEDSSKIGMTTLLLVALGLLVRIAYERETRYKRLSLMLHLAGATCVYLRHMANGTVAKIPFYFSSSGINEVQTFWSIALLILLSYGYRMASIIRHDGRRFASATLYFVVSIWVTISAMLHQPYNVILLPTQILAHSTIDVVLRASNLFDLDVFAHCWLGNVFYFYQGNSNSLASVDVAAGYVGLRSYIPLVTGAYLIINTYSAPVLSYFLLIYYRQLNQIYCTDTVVRTSRTYIAWRLLTITFYMIVVTSQRNHLFVWSVFSPKLLYEAMYSVVMCFSTLLVLIVLTLQATIES
ncbi:GPI ethanolamine phosphate transferase 2 isoform X2 [Pseudomyrmex gracilis]|nr:GPI ethanolamine phosphate transferase 2 isoform X2 [Pseudomyrmex gracilis]